MSNENERRLILEMIDSGKISAEEGLRLLQALPADGMDEEEQMTIPAEAGTAVTPSMVGGVSELSPAAQPIPGQSAPESDGGDTAGGAARAVMPDLNRWRRFWIVPLWVGVGVTIAGGLLMLWASQAAGMGFWLACASLPFVLGVVILALAWQSRTARWLHLRVQQKPGEWPSTFAFSFPLPVRISTWFMRTFHRHIPGMEGTSLDEILAALEHSTSAENPLYIEVEEEDGEHVQIYIG